MFNLMLKKTAKTKFLNAMMPRMFSSEMRVLETVEGHQPPSKEESVEGRYAAVLFTSASKANLLHKIYEDMDHLSQLYDGVKDFRGFTKNPGLSVTEIRDFNNTLLEITHLEDLTLRFIEVLVENKRFGLINVISEKYRKIYTEIARDQKSITIISADDLDNHEKEEVLNALNQNPENIGKQFKLEFQVDPSILGGLIMYTESEFMDMSMNSRINKIRQEIQSLSK